MRFDRTALRWVRALCLAATVLPSAAEDVPADQAGGSAVGASGGAALMSIPGLEARIARAELDNDLDADTKAKVIARYREAIGSLKEAEVNRARGAAFEESARTAPEAAERVRGEATDRAGDPRSDELAVGPDAPRTAIDLELRKSLADLAAAEARRADLERQRLFHENRPVLVRQRVTAAQAEQDAIAAELLAPVASAEPSDSSLSGIPALQQARWWSLESRYVALSSELRALELELLSLPMRLDLLVARRDAEAAEAERQRVRTARLKARLSDAYAREAAQVKADTERLLETTREMGPVLTGLARENAEIAQRLAETVEALDDPDDDESAAIRMTERIEADFERIRAAKETVGLTDGVGALLLLHRAGLPDLEVHARVLRALDERIAGINASRLGHFDEAARIADMDQAVGALAAAPGSGGGAIEIEMMRTLMADRQLLIAKQLEAEDETLKRLKRLKDAEVRLLDAARSYDRFIEEHLFWLGTGAKTRAADFGHLGGDVAAVADPVVWAEVRRSLAEELRAFPLYWIGLPVVVLLLWKRRAMRARIARTSERMAHPATADFSETLTALALTLVVAATPLPLLLGLSGLVLEGAPSGTAVSENLGEAWVRIALVAYCLLLLRAISMPGGLALGHFLWTPALVGRLSSQLRWLIPILLSAMLLFVTSLTLTPETLGGPIARLASMVALVSISVFCLRLFHPRQGVLASGPGRADAPLHERTYPLWYPSAVGFPILILVLEWRGYGYTAHVLWQAYLLTIGLSLALIILSSLARVWLRLARSRLARHVAEERRRLRLAQRGSGTGEAGLVPGDDLVDVDLDASSAAGRELIGLFVVVLGLFGLSAIWSPVFPAMGVLQDVTLWSVAAAGDGTTAPRAVTLADLTLAVAYLTAVFVLVRRLPAMLDIILAERLHVTSSGRYTVTTLATYAIVAVGVVLALNRIGAQWSQLQWLVAALTVGIGFGLQEIVANFVSGLIILFERPVRVGDVVTVGDTDGVVTKIRIRATTVRGYDRKELLIPNKELITGRVLNWSLSDSVTRLLLYVGVAYDTDVDRALALMREAAEENPRILDNPRPILSLDGFGDNALTLSLRAYSEDIEHRVALTSELNMAINRKFRDAGIVIAYPQLDLHLTASEPLQVQLRGMGPSPCGPDASAVSSRGEVGADPSRHP